MTLGRHFPGQNRPKKQTFLGGNSDYQGLNIDLTRSHTYFGTFNTQVAGYLGFSAIIPEIFI